MNFLRWRNCTRPRSEVKAQQALVKAAEIVQALAVKIDDEGLRVGFLVVEPVRL